MRVILIFTLLFSLGSLAEDKKKDDKIFKRQITDTSKRLEIRKGDIMDTKAMLRKTEHPNPEQVLMMKKILAVELGGVDKYKIAARKSAASINISLKSLWKIYLIDQDLKEVNKKLSKKGITKGLKKHYSEKKAKLSGDKKEHNGVLDKNLMFMKQIIKSEAVAGSGDFFENVVEFEGGVDLIDKLGEAKARLKKGTEVKTKVHPKDSSFYIIEHEGETLFAKRGFFKLK